MGARRPCLGVAAAEFMGRFLTLRTNELCYGTPGYLSATAEPLFVSEVLGRDKKGTLKALVAVALPPAATTLHLSTAMGGRRTRSLPASLITPKQASEARLRRFRLVTFELSQKECIREMSTRNRTGIALWESGDLVCPR
jgi:hypothetical protein